MSGNTVKEKKYELPKLPPQLQAKLTSKPQDQKQNRVLKKKEDFSNEYAGKRVRVYLYGDEPRECIFLISTKSWIKVRDLKTGNILYLNKRYVMGVMRVPPDNHNSKETNSTMKNEKEVRTNQA